MTKPERAAQQPEAPGELVIYPGKDGRLRLQARLHDDSLWLTQKQMAELFGVDVRTVSEHLKNIFEAAELAEDSVVRKFRITAADGKAYPTALYHLDAIISVGYRVNSVRATQFRIWATQVLREYIVKGFALDDERLKNPPVAGSAVPDRFDELLEVKLRPLPPVQGALWDFAQGYAHLKRGEVDFANLYLQRVKKTADTSKAMIRVHTAKNLLGVVAGILEGEMARTAGDLSKAITTFQAAFDLQESLTYDEPEPLPFHAGHWLGAALLEAKRPADAEETYRKELAHHPHNGWSLLGLQQALKAQGKPTADVDADLKASWSRADTWIRSSRF